MIRDTSRTTVNILRILPKPFSVLSSLFSGLSNESKNISKHHQTLKCVTLRFGNTTNMIETPSINGHQRESDAHNDPCAFHEYT
jgi:hypothetical protein